MEKVLADRLEIDTSLENAEGMYLDDFTFDCLEEDVEKYEIKNNFSFADNVFCWKCIKKIKHDLGGV